MRPQPRLCRRRTFRCAQRAPRAELSACNLFRGHFLAEDSVHLESLRRGASLRERRSELEKQLRLDSGLEQRFDRAPRLGRGTAAEHLRESLAELAEVPARERGGRVREDVRGARDVAAPPPHLRHGHCGVGIRMAGEMSEQEAFRIFLLAELGELHGRNPISANRLGGKRALDHGEGVLVLAHGVELAGRCAPGTRDTEGIVVSVCPQQVERRGKSVGGASGVVEEPDQSLMGLDIGRSFPPEASQHALRLRFRAVIRQRCCRFEPGGKGEFLVESELLQAVHRASLPRQSGFVHGVRAGRCVDDAREQACGPIGISCVDSNDLRPDETADGTGIEVAQRSANALDHLRIRRL